MLESDKDFRKVPTWVVPLLSLILGLEMDFNKKEETVDMCYAISVLMRNATRKGEKIGEANGFKKGEQKAMVAAMESEHVSRKTIVSSLVKAFSLTPEVAESYLNP